MHSIASLNAVNRAKASSVLAEPAVSVDVSISNKDDSTSKSKQRCVFLRYSKNKILLCHVWSTSVTC